MTHQVLARKWRPKNFDEVIGQTQVVRALRNAFDRQHLHHAYLFTGTRGVGKTTIARIIAKCLNCERGLSATPCQQCNACQEIDNGRFPDLFEVDAASRTKVEDTRELLDNVQYAPSKGRYKVYLIDEVHMLSGHSFNALLKTLEEPPPHVIFLLATTDYQRLPATVLSRCLQFHLIQMTPKLITEQLQMILTKENVNFEAPATSLLAKAANGSMRDALSLLDQGIAFGNGSVKTDDIKTMLGTIEPTALYDILRALAEQDANALLACVDQLAQKSIDFSRALSDLLLMLHHVAIAQAVPGISRDELTSSLQEFSTQFSQEDIQLYYQIGLLGQRDLSLAPSDRSGFEMTLLRMLAFTPDQALNNRPTMPTASTSTKAPSTIAANQTKPTEIMQANSWSDLLNQLDINGATLALAQQCSLKQMSDNQLHLPLNPRQKPLLQDKHIKRISDALTQHFARPVSVKIDLGVTEGETPAKLAKQKETDRLTTAENVIMADQKVQRIMKTFDATVVKDSITRTKE